MAAAGWREAQDARPPARRKSDRLSGTENKVSTVPVKRSIVLKKIEPQKNMPKPVPGQSLQDPRLATCITTAPRRSPRISPKAMKEKVCEGSVRPESAPSSDTASLPVTSSTLETGTWPDMLGDRGSVMSLKVQRSYSRVSPFRIHASSDGAASRSLGSTPSDGSVTSTPNQSQLVRKSFFGFERLLANEALSGVSPVRPLTPKRKGTELPARDIPAAATLAPHDANIPGVTIAKKRKKRKIVPIEKLALDEWAAQMNASFEEAERFDLLVE